MTDFLKWLFMCIGILTVEGAVCLAIWYAFKEHERRQKAKRKRQHKEVIPRPDFRIPPPPPKKKYPIMAGGQPIAWTSIRTGMKPPKDKDVIEAQMKEGIMP